MAYGEGGITMAWEYLFIECPPTYMKETRFCRSCDKVTDYALQAVDLMHTFPCCGLDSCKRQVKRLMAEKIFDARRTGLLPPVAAPSRWRVWKRWFIIQLIRNERLDRELRDQNYELWAQTRHEFSFF